MLETQSWYNISHFSVIRSLDQVTRNKTEQNNSTVEKIINTIQTSVCVRICILSLTAEINNLVV